MFDPHLLEGMVFSKVTSLHLDGCRCIFRDNTFPGDHIALIFPNLEFLELPDRSPLLSVDLQSLKHFTKLKAIRFYNCSIFNSLATGQTVSLSRVEYLDLGYGISFNTAFNALHLPKLRTLDLFYHGHEQEDQYKDVEQLLLDRSPYLCRSLHVGGSSESDGVKRNRLNLGLEMARSRIVGAQPVTSALWPLVLDRAQKAVTASYFDYHYWKHFKMDPVDQSDAIFHILRERACKELFSGR